MQLAITDSLGMALCDALAYVQHLLEQYVLRDEIKLFARRRYVLQCPRYDVCLKLHPGLAMRLRGISHTG